jgi:hypothetical protein
MDSEYGNIWSNEAEEWFCPNGHEVGINDELCKECAEEAYQNGGEDEVEFARRIA